MESGLFAIHWPFVDLGVIVPGVRWRNALPVLDGDGAQGAEAQMLQEDFQKGEAGVSLPGTKVLSTIGAEGQCAPRTGDDLFIRDCRGSEGFLYPGDRQTVASPRTGADEVVILERDGFTTAAAFPDFLQIHQPILLFEPAGNLQGRHFRAARFRGVKHQAFLHQLSSLLR